MSSFQMNDRLRPLAVMDRPQLSGAALPWTHALRADICFRRTGRGVERFVRTFVVLAATGISVALSLRHVLPRITSLEDTV
jgi:hypothetical protein